MNAFIEQTEALITPGGVAHDLLHNLSGSARKNYANLPAHTILRACRTACSMIELIEDYESANMDYAREERAVRDIIHLISNPS
jgi:hypothetical protein